ncbi:hyaluronan receptor for endocytosis-like protein [Camelus ferus]|nr:hyaluronan receptor for endocytosis-like protein [Camelus ferus]
MDGNGSCSCQEGFGGTACEACADDNLFGPSCSAVCTCVHGVCRSGIDGDGTCECYSAYTGPNCDKPINPCLQNICHPHARCTYLGPNRHSCTCQEGYRGDGQVCLPVDPCQVNFGNCPTASTVCRYDGPGQIKELLMDNEAAQYFVKLHIIAGQMNTEQMSNTDTFYTLTGKAGEIFSGDKDNQLKLKLYGGKKKVKIIQGNIVASNGLLHILDRAMDRVAPTFESNTEGSRKLLELVRYHIVPFTQLEVATLISTPHIRSMANQIIQFNTTDNGRILANDVAMEEIEVVAKNGRIYTLTGVLIPPSIVPILPHRCDEAKRELKLTLFTHKCVYTGRTRSLKSGCARYCNATVKIPKCCKGFYGPDCNQCPGGFSDPCSGNGQCADGHDGNGTCICQEGFQGSQCQFCSDPDKYGPQCDKKCLCIFGTCDNRIDSDGTCLAGTCRGGSTGRFCHKQTSACGPYMQFCHIHATCEFSNGTARCVCKAGYEGDGILCSEMDPCLGLTSGGCSRNAECIRTGRGTHTCVCHQGWTGDGRDCSEINNCLLPRAGGCHRNATCLYIGPGQNASLQPMLSAASNLTVLVPSQQAIEDMDQDEKAFWLTKSNIPTLIKYHTLLGTYGVADLQALSPLDMLATSLQGNFLHLAKSDGNITIEGASVIDGDNAATNGVIHIINKVLVPQRGLTGSLPNLLTRLDQMPDYSIFRGYIIASIMFSAWPSAQVTWERESLTQSCLFPSQQYNLASVIEAADAYTVFAPNNDAIESYIQEKKVATLEEDVLRYHVVLEEKLLKNDLHNGMHRNTMLGSSYPLGFFLRNDQLYVNEAPINYTNAATDKGVIHGLGKVLEIQKNRCDINDTTVIRTRECCAGYFGPQCQPCPGRAENVCFGNGICLDGINGTGVCECGEGFNGTACETCAEGKYGIHCDQAINACEISNGGCSAKAVCKRTTPGRRVCVCKAGYAGDGIVCREINPCLENNGGCHKYAECTQTGPNQAVCNCLLKYTGDGKVCTLIDVCLTKNGGCSEFAICSHTGQGERTCTCKPNYVGDGFTCRGNIHQEHSVQDLIGPGPFTVLAPLSAAFDEEPRVKAWDEQGLMAQVLRYHVIACHQLLLENLKLTPNATSLQGESIAISVSQDTVFINNKAKIISSDIISTNGIIHIIDKLLSPQNLLITPKDASGRILDTGLLSVITDPIHTPVTLFWPSDQALQALPPEQQAFLFNEDNKDKLKEYLKFHVIRDSKVFCFRTNILAVDLPRSATWKTLQGSELSVKCGAGSDIEMFSFFHIEEKLFSLIAFIAISPEIVQRELLFDLGVAYGIDCLLIDPTLGGRCDAFTAFDVSGNCGSCVNTPSCPTWTKPKGKKQKCLYDLPYRRNLEGCKQQCTLVIQLPKCCKGYFWPDCQACGCSDHGHCDDGITGSGQCVCELGWTGRLCDKQTVVDFCKQNNGGCAKVAKCSQKGTEVSCSCQKGYQGDGHSCTEIDLCADGLNGRCHEHATCQMTGPGKHKCKCKAHYVGDGLDCEPEQLPLDRCLQDNGQCHANADCVDLHFQDTTVGVFHLRSPLGQYKLTFDKAKEACAKEAATIATYNQLSYAQKAKYHLCSAGWLDSGRVAYPTSYASQSCGSGVVGIVDYGTRSNKNEMWDVFCYRMKDVNCTCKAGYVGDGFSCSGNLLQVLMSFPSLTNFLTEVLAYSNSSARGRAFLKHLTDLSIRSTLFVPQNSGLGENETLSGQDIEHHLSNVSIFFYNDLVNGTILNTRLGSRLLITSSQDQHQVETRFVNGRAILQWDIFASNGIIHVISRPLKAPSTPVASSHTGLGTGVSFAIILVIGAIILAAYSYLRLNRRTTGFQRFERAGQHLDARHILPVSWVGSVPEMNSSSSSKALFLAEALGPGFGSSTAAEHPPFCASYSSPAHPLLLLPLPDMSGGDVQSPQAPCTCLSEQSDEDIDVAALGKQQPEDISNPMYESTTSATPEPSYNPFTDPDDQPLGSSDPLGAL